MPRSFPDQSALRLIPAGFVPPGGEPPLKLKGRQGRRAAVRWLRALWARIRRLKLKWRLRPIRPFSERAIQGLPLKLKGWAQSPLFPETLRYVIRRSRVLYVCVRYVGSLRNVTLHGFRHRFDQTLSTHPLGCRDVTELGITLRP